MSMFPNIHIFSIFLGGPLIKPSKFRDKNALLN